MAMGVIKPVLVIVAIEGLAETQAFEDAAVPDPVSCKVVFKQRSLFPEIVGKAFTTIFVSREHPLLLVYVIFVVPAETAVTRPVVEMVANEVLPETHGLVVAAVPFPINCKFASLQTDEPPVIVGSGFTAMVMVVFVAHNSGFGVNV